MCGGEGQRRVRPFLLFNLAFRSFRIYFYFCFFLRTCHQLYRNSVLLHACCQLRDSPGLLKRGKAVLGWDNPRAAASARPAGSVRSGPARPAGSTGEPGKAAAAGPAHVGGNALRTALVNICQEAVTKESTSLCNLCIFFMEDASFPPAPPTPPPHPPLASLVEW